MKKYFLSFFLLLLISLKLYSESWAGDNKEESCLVNLHHSIKSLSEIEAHLGDPKDSLIIFDVDYVLTHPKELAFQFPNFAKNMHFVKELFTSLSALERDLFANLMVFDQAGCQLVEKTTPLFIQQLQKKGYKVIALTATLTSPLKGLNIKENRFKTLSSFGIDFSKSFPEHEEITFRSLLANRNTYPLFYKGILFSNGENQANQKGAVLKEFLEKISFDPKHIVFVDDRKPNLDSIQEIFKLSNAKVSTFQYNGSLLYPSLDIEKKLFEEKWIQLAEDAKRASIQIAESCSQNDI